MKPHPRKTCPVGRDVRHAAALLRGGGLVAFATETVYGLGADALNAPAVARVFEVKGRPRFDPLIVHIAEVAHLEELAAEVPDEARRLVERFWPGPLTLVLPKTDIVPDLVTSGLPMVAVRMPGHPLALELLREADVPVAAPSANPFGRISPTRAGHVAEQLGGRIDYILDGGPCRVGVESTVLQWTPSGPVLLRPGGLPLEDIEAVVGPVARADTTDRPESAPQPSPGMLLRHYAPRTPLVVADDDASAGPRTGLLSLTPPSDSSRYAVVEVLSPSGDLTEAAAGFFAALRRLDARDLDLVVARPFPEHGLGRALNDRLRRASHGEQDMMHDVFLREAIRLAVEGVDARHGGPFGAVVVRDGQVIGSGCNQVTLTNDPTAHAEIVAIREACRALGDYQLAGCRLYASCEPCPMCLAAAYWSRLDEVVYAATRHDAAAAGFDDEFLYRELGLFPAERRLRQTRLGCDEAAAPFAAWQAKTDRIPY